MRDRFDDVTQDAANELCDAATSIFFAVACFESARRGGPIRLPWHLCPKRQPPCPCTLDPDLVNDAEQFLLRLGVIYFDDHCRARLSLSL